MARRSRDGALLVGLLGIAAKLPWWLSIGIAAASYFALHVYAERDLATAVSTTDIGAVVVSGVLRTMATIGQYVVPMIFGVGALASVLGQRRRGALFRQVSASETPASLEAMSWEEFEELVQEYYRLRGWSVCRMDGDGADGGVDLELRRGAQTVLVQCKQWRALKVGVSVVRELYGVMAAREATNGIVVTSGGFTRDAMDFASGLNMQLIDGPGLFEMIREVRAAAPRPVSTPAVPSTSSPSGARGCPLCGSPMKRRTARRGEHAGEAFYGCSRFPLCRGVVRL